jgi:Domain of unknown function (DUF4126)
MGSIQTLASILGLSFVSGVNLYLGTLITGLCIRYHWVTGLPHELNILAHPAVLITAGTLYLLEFFADKIPFITPIWDFVHTFIRPIGGALLALGAAADLNPILQTLATLAGGTIALSAHGTKMGFRLAAHSVPTPPVHAAISVAEDVGVAMLLALVYKHPYIATGVILLLLIWMALVIPMVLRALRFIFAGLIGRVSGPARRDEVEHWADEHLLALDPDSKAPVLRAFSKSVLGSPKLKQGYLIRAKDRWHFVHKKWLRPKVMDLDEGRMDPLQLRSGWFYDTVSFVKEGKVQHFYLTKDWSQVAFGSEPPTFKPVESLG